MDESTQGIVLRTYPLTETSLIVHWLTRDLGRIATVAKGARRPKSSFSGKLDLFHLCDLALTRSRRSELHTLKEVTLIDANTALRFDFDRLHKAVYAAALVEQATETDSPVPELFALLISFIQALAQNASSAIVFGFELKLLWLLGMDPGAADTPLSPGAKKLIEFLCQSDWERLRTLRMSQPQANELRHFLGKFLVFHLGKAPRSRDKALKVAAKRASGRES